MSTYERVPFLVVFPDTSSSRDVYGGTGDIVALEGHLLKPDTPSDTVIVMMHPIGGGSYLPMTVALAKAGHHVVYCNSRYRGADHALIMEKVTEDLAACVRHVRDRFGYAKVVLAGWSGGGALSAFYQAEAEKPTVTATPTGEGPDLTALDLVPADAVMFLAAHVSRHRTLTEWMDASILDEHDPTVRDPSLDLYGTAVAPPYDQAFLDRYRDAQIARNRRITAWVRAKLAAMEAAGRGDEEFGFVVHGTMADPRWLDPAVDPNDREPGVCYLGDPRIVNNGPVGLARFTTLRSWLSQWSYDDARADIVDCAPAISVPILVIGNSADDACTPSHTERIHEAFGVVDKQLHTIAGATHYYAGPDQKDQLAEAVGIIDGWLTERGFAGTGA
ncbi:MAG: alpha/beta fold hydrolase [Actinomycetota bacterium]|nr:alpha/beta fold hydrolase [Actinomycetota bacterium]